MTKMITSLITFCKYTNFLHFHLVVNKIFFFFENVQHGNNYCLYNYYGFTIKINERISSRYRKKFVLLQFDKIVISQIL